MIRRLANDVKKWAEFRNSLRGQIRTAEDFTLEYEQRFNENQTLDDLRQVVDEFKSEINDRIAQLDQTVRHLSQIVSTATSFSSFS